MNTQQYISKISTIFYAIVGGPLMLFSIIYLRFKSERGGLIESFPEDITPVWHILFPLAALLAVIAAYVYYHRLKKQILPAEDHEIKLKKFYQASLVKYSILAIASLLMIASLYVTTEKIFAAGYAIVLVVFSLNRPTPYRIKKDGKLSEEELNTLYE
jgi:hypothetical protein